MAARFVALGDDDVDTGRLLPLRMLTGTDERGDVHVGVVRCVDELRRRRAECVHDETDRTRQCDVDERLRALVRPGALAGGCDLALGQWRHVVAGEQVVEERLVLGRDHGGELVLRQSAFLPAGVLLRDDHVDPVTPVRSDLALDPGAVDLELFGRVCGDAEHAHATGLGDRGDDVAAVAEREDRELDAEHVADLGLHAVMVARAPG